MTGLTLEIAQRIVAAALGGPRTSPGRFIAVAVCDAGGHPLALAREERAAPLRAHIAQMKAFTCIAVGQPSAVVAEDAQGYETWFDSISTVAEMRMGGPLIATAGGVLIQDAGGAVLGAVGVAGEASSQDELLAVTGIEAVGLTAKRR
jgi:uncharacterized protein GlcG (DUF336 family)